MIRFGFYGKFERYRNLIVNKFTTSCTGIANFFSNFYAICRGQCWLFNETV